jgi:hypothetical protein
MNESPLPDLSRRRFVQTIATGAALAAVGRWQGSAGEPVSAKPGAPAASSTKPPPWYRHALRWGQVNLTEIDPTRFDLGFWREYWRRTALQGVVVNAGGIVAYYPTEVPLHRRARFLGERDLFGETAAAARADGLAVFARMDSNRADEEFYRAHPDWFACDADGVPYRVTDLYVACVNSPYYTTHIPAILREVATRYRPSGFADNNWNGPMRNQPCFCANCERVFRARTGQPVPRAVDWNSRLYREWVIWNYERRTRIWDEFNRVTREAGGPECIWVGMMAGSLNWQSRVFRDDRELYRRAELVMLDHQRRPEAEGFAHNAETGQRIHAVGGWDKVVPESTALYQAAEHNFRLAAKPEPEVRLWAVEGFAGGIQPWWHMVGAQQSDRRIFDTPEALWQWHRAHEEVLVNRVPVATVALLWSQRNMDFFGRDEPGALVDDPWNGIAQALVRARIPFVPVHVDDLQRDAAAYSLRVAILPNLAAISDAQLGALRGFVQGGGSLLATGASTLCNEWGDVRADLGLADLLGVHVPAGHAWRDDARRTRAAKDWQPTYLRLPAATAERPAVLRGFDATDLLAFGGELEPLTVDPGAVVPLTFVPPVPTMPVESVWMREPSTSVPGLVLREHAGGGRIAHLAADLDRRYARDHLPDHARLLANLVRWTLRDELPIEVQGAGLVDCHVYRQRNRLILHVVNLTNAGTWRSPVEELTPVGPLQVRVRLPGDVSGSTVRSLVSPAPLTATRDAEWFTFQLPSVVDHEVLVIG